MKSILVFALLSAAADAFVVFDRGVCNANNCARAVTGTAPGKTPGVTSRQADCSSFMLTTVSPNPTTVTITESVTDHQIIYEKRAAVTVVPSAVPAYASPCSSAAAYSSACSCWGITAKVTTAPTPTVYATTTTVIVTVETKGPCVGATEQFCHDLPICADDPNRYCFCGVDTNGSGFCASAHLYASCADFDECDTDAQCSAGHRCLTPNSTCCGGSEVTGRCLPFAPRQCGNPAADARRALRAGTKQARARVNENGDTYLSAHKPASS